MEGKSNVIETLLNKKLQTLEGGSRCSGPLCGGDACDCCSCGCVGDCSCE